jgi:hypothetical protein
MSRFISDTKGTLRTYSKITELIFFLKQSIATAGKRSRGHSVATAAAERKQKENGPKLLFVKLKLRNIPTRKTVQKDNNPARRV